MNTQTLNKNIRKRTAIVQGMLASIVLMLLLSVTVDASEAATQPSEEYAMVMASGKLLSLTKWKVAVDFGQELKIGLRNKDLLRDENGSVISFNSPIDAVNHLHQHGWLLVSANSSGDQFSAIMKRSIKHAQL